MKMNLKAGFAFPLLAMLFAAGCSNEDTPGPPSAESMFTVDVRSITHTEATVVVNPVDPAMPYTFDVIEKAAFDKNYNGSVEAVVNGYIDYMTQEEKMPLAEVLENMRSVGDDYYDFSTLDPETDYVAYAIGLGDSGTCTTLPTVKQFRTADLDPVKPKDCTFRVSVSDISVTRAIIDVEPSDKTVPYYFDVIAADRLAAADSPAAALEELMAEGIAYFRSQGYSLEDAIKELRSVGNDGIDLEYGTLKALTKYSVVAGGIDEWGRVNTEVATKEFTTQAVSPSDNTFSIAVEEITAIGAMVTVTPTNNDPYYAAVFEAAGLEGRTDAEIVAAVEQTGSIDWQTRTGKGELDYSQDLESDTNYLVVVFGYREGATTPVSRQTFRTEQGGDPALCEFEFDMITESRIANMGVLPSDETVSYIFGMIAKSDYIDDEMLVEIMQEQMEEEAEMAGITLDELFSVARYRGIGEASFPFVSLQEYVLYAYAINRDFSAAGPVFTEAWTAPEIKVSTATATVVWSKYYDGEALYAYDPETYSDGQMNLAFIPTTIEHSDDAAEWYAAIYADDLTDRSDLSIINNLLKSGQKNPTTLSYSWAYFYDVAYWGATGTANTFCAVALDAEGNYGPVFRSVAMPLKSGCSPISDLVGNTTAIKADRPVPFSSVSVPAARETAVSVARKAQNGAQAMNHKLFEGPAAPREKAKLTSLRHAEYAAAAGRVFGVRLR
ncbi:hypothetical protein [Alistipes sp.]|uniref:hypothetical protein n=1 Tax=Alistipes sp. TaxID=1872444 RepID=UPI003AB169CC